MQNRSLDIPYLGCDADKIKSANPTINETNLTHFYNMVTERYRIFKRREEGQPAPWTDDWILKRYRFTNVRREHDRVSKWLIKNISTNPDLSIEDKFWQTFMFRLYNRDDTAEFFNMGSDFQWNPNWEELDKRTESENHDFYTRAFKTIGITYALKRRYGLENDINRKLLAYMFVNELRNAYNNNEHSEEYDCPILKDHKFSDNINAQDVFDYFIKFKGIGDFMAYQLFVDLTYIPEFPISENEFVVAGPGCRIGLCRLFNDFDELTHEEILFWLRDNIDNVFKSVDENYDPEELFDNLPEYDRHFNVMSLENCFCEFGKYMYAIDDPNDGPRRKYLYNEG